MVALEKPFLKHYDTQPYIIKKKAELLFRFSLTICCISLIGLIFQSGVSESVFYLVGLGSYITVIWCISRGTLNAAIWITAIMASVCIFCDVMQFHPLVYERIVETTMESFLVYIVIGFVAVSKRQVAYTVVTNTVLTALHAAIILRLGYAHTSVPAPAYRYFIGGTVAVLIVGLLTLAIVSIHEQAMVLVEQRQQVLAVDKEHLEKLVNERTFELEQANEKLETLNNELTVLSMYDPLTGLRNRRKVLGEFAEILHHGCSPGHKIFVCMLDMDHFKQINDTYGHQTGDIALQTVAKTIHSVLHPSDIIGRIGGEEFLIVLEESTLDDALRVLSRIQSAVERASVPARGDMEKLYLTVSIGVSEMRAGQSVEELMQEADIALYQSKENGRNQVTMYKKHIEAGGTS